ncbi:hypothetical protein CEUSTIGMA_g3315.t1 [Chlamydomonas eustigma]|uniref:VTT domain-containing protein n=1 Tax=Chlamydomonas eustigma TaxID=1157962 RepID=A0A250WZ32_9CHLO|nr:hypothetical protein CEUSTIGMA_g3315.t1 [Chlamydomonas eustigma]|eukprot:GAX75872.1 hypothetical protein CEUSTIGMA_g3315.t1 [Chlamydomonas eustigma]
MLLQPMNMHRTLSLKPGTDLCPTRLHHSSRYITTASYSIPKNSYRYNVEAPLDTAPSTSSTPSTYEPALARNKYPKKYVFDKQAVISASVALVASQLLLPGPGHCEEALTGSAFIAFKEFLDYVQALGPAGPAVFVAAVMVFEMVPLFPTQPLSLAGGLLFGPVQGALGVLLGVTLAAINAFWISRGIGRKLAERVIKMEMGEGGGDGSSSQNAVAMKLEEVKRSIESGGVWQQLTAITLLRLTPVVPFSASNYVLGLTPVKLESFIGGTVLGMSAWSLVYASLGAASRKLLDKGEDMATLFADLSEKAGAYSVTAIKVSVVVGLGLGVFFWLSSRAQKNEELKKSEEALETERLRSEAEEKILQESK